jgi:hypothetical protein
MSFGQIEVPINNHILTFKLLLANEQAQSRRRDNADIGWSALLCGMLLPRCEMNDTNARHELSVLVFLER